MRGECAAGAPQPEPGATQRRSGTAAVGNLDLGRDVDALFAAKPDNVFLVKMSYWLGL